MPTKEQIIYLENQVLKKLDIFLNSNETSVYDNYLVLLTLDNHYQKLTGKSILKANNYFDEFFKNHRELIPIIFETHQNNQDYINFQTSLNIKKLNSQNFFKTIYLPIEEYYRKNKNYLNQMLNNRDNIKLNLSDISNIITEFLKNTNPKYQNLYNELVETNRVIFVENLEEEGLSFIGLDSTNNNDLYIMINSSQDILSMMESIAHELGHIIANLELIEKEISPIDFRNYQVNSIYHEIDGMYQSLKFIDFLNKINIDEELIKKQRINWLFSGGISYMNDIINEKGDFYAVKRAYGMIIPICLDNIFFKHKLQKKEEILNKEKLVNQDIDILGKLNINANSIKRAITKQLKKI